MGPGSLDSAADEMKRLGGKNVMIITDPGLVSTGIVERLEKLLSVGGLSTTRFDAVEPEIGRAHV